MKRSEFRQLVSQSVLILDGAMGTMLQRAVPVKLHCPEIATVDYKSAVQDIHRAYVAAGCNIIQTNTLGGNRLKLGVYGLSDRVDELNRLAAATAKEAVRETPGIMVAGDIGPSGRLMAPMGDLTFAEAVDVFREQAASLAAGGADLILIETMADVHEAKAAAIGARMACDLPILVSLTYDEDLRTLTGSSPESAAVVLDALDIDAIGANCGFGPDMFISIIEGYARVTDLPLFAEPNAGLPHMCDGASSFNLSPDDMASYVEGLIAAGASLLGGCCGTSPEHLKAISARAANARPTARKRDGVSRLAGTTDVVTIGDSSTRLIGECINVSARKALTAAVAADNYAVIADEALAEYRDGADVIDVNMGLKLKNVTEREAMIQSVLAVQRVVGVPLSIDSVDTQTVEEALGVCRGKPLINSTNGEPAHMERTLQLARKYGAAVLGLTLDEHGIPDCAEDRFAIAERIVTRALEIGLRREDIYIDTLTLTAGSKQELVPETLKTLRMVRERLGVRTILGVSNISHGLPNRAELTAAFILTAIDAGLDMAIANPHLRSIWSAIRCGDVLRGRDQNASAYIEWAGDNPLDGSTTNLASSRDREASGVKENNLTNAVIKGDKSTTLAFVESMLAGGLAASEIVNGHLIPALEEVGERYEKKVFYLPQLLSAAEAAQSAFGRLSGELSASESNNTLGTYILATVKGDMHDIGKNIVGIMLRNHGFRVIDLGRDVDSTTIVQTALKEHADLIGLSSLMTTTMGEMETVVKEMHIAGCSIPLMVGGAVVTPEYASMIGAHYSCDAIDAVRVAKQLLGK